jgi:agmatinase
MSSQDDPAPQGRQEGGGPRYGPSDPLLAPRYTGMRTFARLPHVTTLEGVDLAILGVPFDTGTSYRPGPRFGPEHVRAHSTLLRPYHPILDVNVFETLSCVDAGDIAITPGNAARTTQQIADALRPVLEAGVVPVVVGGDHTIALGELRAHAAVHGPVALVLLDAHADVWDRFYGEPIFHGTPFRRAVEEGLVLPERSLLAGMRGSLYGREDLGEPAELGFQVIPHEELVALSPAEYGARVRERVGDAPAVLSFDIDVLDPAFAPGTGTPEAGGLTMREAQGYLRSLAGMRFRGFDLVEVSAPYDTPGATTGIAAANVMFELLALAAVASGRAGAA